MQPDRPRCVCKLKLSIDLTALDEAGPKDTQMGRWTSVVTVHPLPMIAGLRMESFDAGFRAICTPDVRRAPQK
jgi:hypothetical protein